MPYPITNQCNFNCSFCDKQWVDPNSLNEADILRDAPMSELSGLRAVLGGGEPTMHPRLPALIEGLKAQKVNKISLRSNAAWASQPNLVQYLKKKGLTELAIFLPSIDEEQFNALVRKKNAFHAVMEGIRNLIEANIAIVLRIPILKSTLTSLPEMLDALPIVIGDIKRIDLVYMDMKNPTEQVPFDAINDLFPFGSQHPNPKLPPIHLDPGPGIPLCWTESMKEWAITPDCPTSRGHFSDKCESCFVKHNCSGFPRSYLNTFGDDRVEPFASPVENQASGHQELIALKDERVEKVKGVTYECAEGGEVSVASMRLRVGHQCNRRCEFCFIPHHEKAVQDYDIENSIEAAVKAGVRELVMTGGEPTLQNDLPVYIQKASELGVRRIILQTNGIRLANEEYCQKLVDAGLTTVVISLHSHRDDILRDITKQPKTIDRILRGIANLHAAGIQVSLTHVIGPRNYNHLPEFAKFMVEEANINRFCFIFATPMSWPMATEEIVVRYSDAAPYLMEAMDYCIDKGVIIDGIAFKCGAPHCVVNGEPRYLVDAVNIPDNNRTDDWVRVPACKTCVLKDQCYGVRRLYVWMYGADEFRPILDESKRIEHWKSDALQLSESEEKRRDSFQGFSHKITPTKNPYTDVSDLLLELVRGKLVTGATVQSFQNSFRIVQLNDDLGFRVHHSADTPTSIGCFDQSSSIVEAKMQAMQRTIRAFAFNIPLAGAHGCLNLEQPTEGSPPLARALASLSQQLTGTDLVTPHTSLPSSEMERVAEGTPFDNIQFLRTSSFADKHNLRMTSVDSCITIATEVLAQTPVKGSAIRYSIWGYGRAGQRFAERFDPVSIANNGRVLRPKLIGCADRTSSWIDPNGLEHERMSAFKRRNGRLPFGDRYDSRAILFEETDLLLLCGKGCPLSIEDISKVNATVVIDMTGSVSQDLESELLKRGIRFVPSVISTSGPFLLSVLELAATQPEEFRRLGIDNPFERYPGIPLETVFQRYMQDSLGALLQQTFRSSEENNLTATMSFVYKSLRNWESTGVDPQGDRQ